MKSKTPIPDTSLAIIGGTGLTGMNGLTVTRREMVKTPYGAPSCPLVYGELNQQKLVFMARHGSTHRIPPHRVNYCANIWALHSVGIRHIIAVNAVGGIASDCVVGAVVIPDQIIDYTRGRVSTYFDGGQDPVEHIEFSFPYDEALRQALIGGAKACTGITLIEQGTYGATQGPRLETAAEIQRLARDGCSIVGMTGMPEAALAAELGVAYASCSIVINPAAGITGKRIDREQMSNAVTSGMNNARAVLSETLSDLHLSSK